MEYDSYLSSYFNLGNWIHEKTSEEEYGIRILGRKKKIIKGWQQENIG